MPTNNQRRLFAVILAFGALNLLFPQQAVAARRLPGAQIVAALPLRQLPVVPIKPITVKRRLIARISAYTSTRDQTDATPFTTASGSTVREGTLAMNGVPFGTRVRIPDAYGDRVFVVEDRMNARYGRNHADIWMTTRDAARRWGRRTHTLEILE
jgi:3D (Asp-Asp-Asp) domain-containing protein